MPGKVASLHTHSKVDTNLRRLALVPQKQKDPTFKDEVLPSFSEFSRLLVIKCFVFVPSKIRQSTDKSTGN